MEQVDAVTEDPYRITASEVLDFEEGFSEVPYHDSEGFVTIGFGNKLSSIKDEPLDNFKGISKSREGAALDLAMKIETIHNMLGRSEFTRIYKGLSHDRQVVIISMCYQMGMEGVRKFQNMWIALDNHNYDLAVKEMLDSRWEKQTPARAMRHAFVMRDNDLLSVYGDKI